MQTRSYEEVLPLYVVLSPQFVTPQAQGRGLSGHKLSVPFRSDSCDSAVKWAVQIGSAVLYILSRPGTATVCGINRSLGSKFCGWQVLRFEVSTRSDSS